MDYNHDLFVITAGDAFTDIDVLSSAVAYEELCALTGKAAVVVLPGKFNESISSSVRTLISDKNIVIVSDQRFNDRIYVIVDVSDPKFFAKFVNLEKVVQIYDHHFGFEEFWTLKIGSSSKIEHVGACATLIWEEFKNFGKAGEISLISAKLLYTAIISNTLNLNAQITTARDISGVSELATIANIPDSWKATYFNEVNESILKDPINALQKDTKILEINNIPFVMAQLELWDGRGFIDEYLDITLEFIKSFGIPYCLFTCPSISEGKNYIITDNAETMHILSLCVNANFRGFVGETDKLWLRKEIIKCITNSSSQT